RVGEPGAVVVALRRHEHLGLVLQAPERLAVDDPVAVALERRAHAATLLGDGARGRVRRRGERRERLGLPRAYPRLEGLRDRAGRVGLGLHAHGHRFNQPGERITRAVALQARSAAWAAATRAIGTRNGE